MSKAFHLSFSVKNLDQAKVFYTEYIGCEISHDNGSWVNIVFFGHQLTIHQENSECQAQPIDHFGPILDKPLWLKILHRCQKKNILFEMQPLVTMQGTQTESGKFIIKDPAGNILEFKYYLDGFF